MRKQLNRRKGYLNIRIAKNDGSPLEAFQLNEIKPLVKLLRNARFRESSFGGTWQGFRKGIYAIRIAYNPVENNMCYILFKGIEINGDLYPKVLILTDDVHELLTNYHAEVESNLTLKGENNEK